MSKNQESLVIQFVLEVRFKSLYFEILDKKGGLAKELLKKLQLDKLKFSEGRLEFATDDFRNSYFLSTGNFGIQINKATDFDEFKKNTKKFIESLQSIDEFHPDIFRIGTKAGIFYHKKGWNFDAIKNKVIQKFVPNLNDLTKLVEADQVEDVGVPLNFKSGNKSFNTHVGPMRKEQLLTQIFDPNPFKYENVASEGLYYGIDLFEIDVNDFSISNIYLKIDENISLIEKKFNAIKNWIQN
ncbi:MAG: hypothetical protein KW802_01255 [Candidatus Doudnabacteria bacterium]|nr:hypothetical protein [Candidatus Doudnabacteria bacterium]